MSCNAEANPALRSAYGGYRWWKQPFIFVVRYPQGAACTGWVFELLQIFDHTLVRVGSIHEENTSKDLLIVYGGQKVWWLHVLVPRGIVILSFQGWTQHEGRFYHISKLCSSCGGRLVSLIVRLLDRLKSFCWPNVIECVTLWTLQCACWAKLLAQNALTMRSERTRDLGNVKEHHSASFGCLGSSLCACFI